MLRCTGLIEEKKFGKLEGIDERGKPYGGQFYKLTPGTAVIREPYVRGCERAKAEQVNILCFALLDTFVLDNSLKNIEL